MIAADGSRLLLPSHVVTPHITSVAGTLHLAALASIILVLLLVFANPAMFRLRIELPFELWFDLIVWSGVLMVAGYETGTRDEPNQKSLREMEQGHDGMLVILQNFLANRKYSETHACRIFAVCQQNHRDRGL